MQPMNNNPTSAPAHNFAVNDLAPKQQTVWRFKSSARTTLQLANKSECAAQFQLTGQAEAPGCYIEFEGAGGTVSQADLTLEAGQTVSVPVRVILPPLRLLALRREQFFFTVTAALLADHSPRRPLLGQINRAPLISPALMTLVIVALLLLVWQTTPSSSPSKVDNSPPADPITAETSPTPFVMPVYQAGNTPPAWPEEPARPDTAALTYQQLFQDVARQHNLDWRLLAEIAYQESRFNPWAIGRSNEMGLMQIHPVTWQAWAPKVGVFDPYDPYSNVQVAAAFLVHLQSFCQSRGYPDPYWVLIGYNWGPNNLSKLFQQQGGLDQVPEKPRQYALRILQLQPEAPLRRQVQLERLVTPTVSMVQSP